MILVFGIFATNLEVPPVSATTGMSLEVDYTPDSATVATSVTPGNKVDLTATAPVAVAGTTEQEIVQDISATLKLTATTDIIAPAGWTISYSTDGTTWSTTAPTTVSGWNAVRKVKARGQLISQGADSNGRQIASTDANAGQPTTGQFPTTSGSSGDGWDVFFDDGGRLYNVWHHNGGGSNQSMDCYLRSGVRCNGTWPYLLTSGSFTFHTNEQSTGVYDPIEKEIWFPTVYTAGGVNQVGFACIRVDDITLANKWCGGSAASAFVSAGAAGNIVGSTCMNISGNTALYTCTGGLAISNGRLFSWHVSTGDLMCVDIRANGGAGAPCSSGGLIDFGATLTDVSSNLNRWRPLVLEWGGRIYGNGGRNSRAVCIEAATGSACTGWTNPRTVSNIATRIFQLPTPIGGVAGVCFIALDRGDAPTCFDSAGTDITSTLTSTFKTSIDATYRSTFDAYGGILYNYQTRLYWGDAGWNPGTGKIYCWDFGSDSWCRNWTSSGIADTNYQIVLDPYNPNCLWSNSHDGIIQTYDTYSAAMGNCAVPAPTAVFDAGVVVPRMACSSVDAIQGWLSFVLNTTSTFSSATLTVKNSSGTSISGWTNITIPGNNTVDLSTLPITSTGQNPTFTVTFSGRTTNGDVSARITAVGGAPQLCLRPTAPLCPTGTTFTAGQFAATTAAVTADGSATAGATVTPLTQATANVSVGAMTPSLCTSSLSGTARDNAATPNAIAGATVTLTDSAGTTLNYPSDYGVTALRGQPITATTDASGNYSFTNLAPGAYKVSFRDVSTAAVISATVTTGGSGTTTETTTAVTSLLSPVSTITTATSGVVNAVYAVMPTLTKKFFPTTVAKGQISTLIFTLTNSPGNPAKTGLGFVDTLPTGLVVDTNSNMMTTCSAGGGNVTRDPASMTATTGVVTVTNASITAGVASCEYSIAVRADVAGDYTNNASNVTTTGLVKDTLATKVVTDDTVSGKFTCDANMYHIMNDQLYRMDPRDSRIISYEIGPKTLSGIDAIGFNNQDGFMYGIATSASNGRTAGNLVRIDSSGVVTDLGSISGVTAANMTGIKGGDFDDSGNLVVHSYLNTATIYSINVSTRVATVITANAAFPADDMAYYNGFFYSIGWDGSNSKLFTIRKSDWTVTTKTVLPDTGTNAGEGIFINGFGELIIVRTPFSTTHKFWRLSNPQTVTSASEWVLMGTGDGRIQDGAMCHSTPNPTAFPDTSSGPLNTAQTKNLLTNDTTPLSAAGATSALVPSTIRLCDPSTSQVAPNCTVAPGSTITVANVGTYSVSNLGVITFTPATGYTGTPAPLGYQVADGNGNIGNSTYTPTVSSTTPVAFNDTSSGPYDTNQVIDITGNDIAGSLYPLDEASIKLCAVGTPDSACLGSTLDIPNEGIYSSNPDGTVTFDPYPSFKGTATPIKYTILDTNGQLTTATIAASVTAPTAPVASPDTRSVIPGATATFTTTTGTSGLATAAAGFNTSATCLIIPASSPATCDADGVVQITGQGTYTLNTTTGVVTYEAEPDATAGPKTAITYQVTDVTGQKATSTLTPTVPPAPTADNETSTGGYNTDQVIDVLTGDAAGAGATLDTTSVKLCATTSTLKASCDRDTLEVAGQGTYRVNANGTVTFDPLPTFTGTASLVKYVVADSTTQLAEATIQPTVTAPATPVANPESKSVLPGATATFTTTTGTSGLATAAAGFNASLTCLITPASNPAACDADGVVEISGQGTYTLNTTTGVVTYVADAAATAGTKTAITYQVTDITGQKATSTLTPTIPPPPTADNETSTGAYDTNQVIDVLTGDAAGAGATLVATSVKLCATTATLKASCDRDTLEVAGQGTYSVNSNGTVTFDPLPSFTGTASLVKYVVADSTTQRAEATIQPTVSMPAPPTATANAQAVIPGGTVAFTTITGVSGLASSVVGLTASATCLITPGSSPDACDADGVVIVSGVGTYTLNTTTGVVTLVADPAATQGTKTALKYQVTDTFGQTATSTLTPTIPAPPTAGNDTSSDAYDTNQIIVILTNDAATAPATLVATSVKLCATILTAKASCNLNSLEVPGEGTYSVNSNGTVTFNPLPSFTGTASLVKYVVADSTTQRAEATIQPTVAMPTPPTATANAQAVIPGGTVAFTTITGASGLASSIVGLNASATCLITPGSSPDACDADGVVIVSGVGTYTLNTTTGVVTLVADSAATQGTKTALKYQVTDTFGQTATSTLTPTIPAPPTAANDTSTGAYDANQIIEILTNDAATTPATLVATSVKLCATTATANASCNLNSLEVPGEGVYTVNANGTVTFDPFPTFRGNASPVKYVVSDSTGQVTGANISPIVNPPGAPTALPESKSVIPGGTIAFTTLTGASGLASSPAGLNASVTCLITPGSSPDACDADGVIIVSGVGTYTLNTTTGVVTLVADPSATPGTKASLKYQVTDIFGQTSTSTLTPTIPPPPTADNETSTGAYDTDQVIDVLTGDAAGAGATLNNSSVRLCANISTANASCNLTELVISGEGTYKVNANGTVTFNPLPTFSGTASSVKYVVADSTTQRAAAFINVTVGLPSPPTVNPNTLSVAPGGTASFTTLTGASGLASSVAGLNTSVTCLITPGSSPAACDPDGVVAITGEGTFTLINGVVTYTANANATSGTKTAITYQVTDIFGQVATSTLTPIIPAPPTATNDTSSGAYDTNQTITPATNDGANSPATLVATSVKLCATTATVNTSCNLTSLTVANQGTYTVNANGTVTFDPLPTFAGQAAPVKYVIADSTGQLANATITPTVAAPPPPVATPDVKNVAPGTSVSFQPIFGTGALTSGSAELVRSSLCIVDPATNICGITPVVIEGEGVYTVDVDAGIITYKSIATAPVGQRKAIAYKVTDVLGQTVTSTLTPVIPPAPTIVDDTSSGPWNKAQKLTPMANDAAGTGTTLVATSVKICAASPVGASAVAVCSGTTLTVAGEGTYTVNSDGTVSFVPLPTFFGKATSIKYSVSDALGQVATANISVTVTPPPPPTAKPQTIRLKPGESMEFTSLTAKKGLGSSTIGWTTASTCLIVPKSDPATCDEDGIVKFGKEGTFKLNKKTGVVTFTAGENAQGRPKTRVIYQVTDAAGQKAQSTLKPLIPLQVEEMPATGAFSTLPLIFLAITFLSLGAVFIRSKRYVDVV
jgi:CshA-type fibril repeat protein